MQLNEDSVISYQKAVFYGTEPPSHSCYSSCVKEKGESPLPPRERACILAQDCSVSEWGDWAVIQEGCVDATGNVSPF